ncbi:MAG: hypothetical protein DRN12_08360, partial [Thermoplasmata archaeon]
PDNLDIIYDILHYLLPVDFDKEKIDLSHEEVDGLTGDKIHIIKLKTTKNKHNNLLLSNVFNNLSMEDKKLIMEQRESRLNSEGYFFLRLDKDNLFRKKFVLTDGGNCFHFKIKLAAYPATQEQFMNVLERLFIEMGCSLEK